MTLLLDANVLLALFLESHVHHQRADQWFAGSTERFATCSVTQGSLLRLLMQFAADSSAVFAWRSLQELVSHPRHEYWDDGFGYTEISPRSIQGHRQVTDAWLVELARRRSGCVATFDQGLAADYPEFIQTIPEFASP